MSFNSDDSHLSLPMFEYPLTILEQHLDFMGHVNHATYLSLFEEARWSFVTERGYGLREIQRLQIGPVVLAVEIKYLKELRLRQQLVIESCLIEHEKVVGVMKQRMVSPDREVVYADAVFKFGLMNLKTRRLVPPTAEWIYALGGSGG